MATPPAAANIDKGKRNKFFRDAPKPIERPVYVKQRPKFMSGRELLQRFNGGIIK